MSENFREPGEFGEGATVVSERKSLSVEQSRLVDGLGETLKLFNRIVGELTATGLTVDISSYGACTFSGTPPYIEAQIVRDVREIEIDLKK